MKKQFFLSLFFTARNKHCERFSHGRDADADTSCSNERFDFEIAPDVLVTD